MESTKVQTKKNEVIITTSDTAKMHKMYLVDNLYRKWMEPFIDSDTGEILEIERTELVLERGTYLDVDQLAVIAFHLQCGDITEVTVSDQRRLGRFGTNWGVQPWYVTVQLDKKYKVIVLAQNIFQALDIVEDSAYKNQLGVVDTYIAKQSVFIKVITATKVKCHSVIGLDFTTAYNPKPEESNEEQSK